MDKGSHLLSVHHALDTEVDRHLSDLFLTTTLQDSNFVFPSLIASEKPLAQR